MYWRLVGLLSHWVRLIDSKRRNSPNKEFIPPNKLSGERDITVTAGFQATQVSCGCPKTFGTVFLYRHCPRGPVRPLWQLPHSTCSHSIPSTSPETPNQVQSTSSGEWQLHDSPPKPPFGAPCWWDGRLKLRNWPRLCKELLEFHRFRTQSVELKKKKWRMEVRLQWSALAQLKWSCFLCLCFSATAVPSDSFFIYLFFYWVKLPPTLTLPFGVR